MGLNEKQYAAKHSRSTDYIKRCNDWGLFGKNMKDSKTGVYEIPEDIPVPYKANARIKRNSALFMELLDAADLNQSVCYQMYPNFSKDAFEDLLKDLVSEKLIQIRKTSFEIRYLCLTEKGIEYKNKIKGLNKKSLMDKSERLLANGAAISTIVQTIFLVLSGM